MKENSIQEDIIEEKYTRYLNCETDILDLTIEEAIFILEKDKKNHYVEELLQEAYKVILSDYKRVLKENEELKEYKKIAELTKISCCTAQNCEALNNAIKETLKNQKLQKENEELKTELERQKDINNIINQKGLEKNYEKALEKTMTKFLKNNIDKDFIPVQEVKDKIEEYKKMLLSCNEFSDVDRIKAINERISELQELLEGRK